jgi:hypothetical protein
LKKNSLLKSIPLLYKGAVCPQRVDALKEAEATAMEFLRANCDATLSHEIDPYEGCLSIRWKHEVAWPDITLPARRLADIHNHSIRSVTANLRYDIPMFEREDGYEPAFGNPLRKDFTDQLIYFVQQFKILSKESIDLVFTPISNHLCNQINAAQTIPN